MPFRRVLAIALIAANVFIGGCSCGGYADVEGVVRLKGAPLDGVEVVFMPDPERQGKGPRASAYTDAQGRYKLRTEQTNRSGAVLGAHRVCLIDIGAVTTPAGLPGMSTEGGAPPGAAPKARESRVPLRYNNPATTPLQVVVVVGPQTFDFDVVDGKP